MTTRTAPKLLPPLAAQLLPFYILIFATVAAYSNIFDNEFLYDDYGLITHNAFLQNWHSLGAIFTTSSTAGAGEMSAFYRPLQILIYFFIYQIAGLSTAAFHTFNLTLHAANACLIYMLGKKLNFNPTAVFLAALIWALHPLQVEAVTYISDTADLLSAFFCLCAMITLLPDFAPNKFYTASAFFILALLSKESSMALPFMAAGSLFCLRPDRWKIKTYARTWPLWAITLAYALLRFFLLNFHYALQKGTNAYTENILTRIQTFFAMVPLWAKLLIWPAGLHFDRGFIEYTDFFSPAVLLGFAMLLTMTTWILCGARKQTSPLGWGLMWCLAAYLPCTGILKPLNSTFEEHWIYLSSAGLFLGISQTIATHTAPYFKNIPSAARIIPALLIASTLGCATYKQNTVWKDVVSLSNNIFENGENSPDAHVVAGFAFVKQKQYDEALKHFQQAIDLSGDHSPDLHNDYAATLHMKDDLPANADAIIAHLKRAIEIDPDFYPAINNLAKVYNELGNEAEAAHYAAMAQTARNKLNSPLPLAGEEGAHYERSE